MPALVNLKGQRFGRLTVIERASNQGGKVMWQCRCDCGNERIVQAGHLRNGAIQSCGCLLGQQHGEAGRGRRSPEYQAWQNMKRRCYNPKDDRYAVYGGRGITVCDRWRDDYPAFLVDMGRRPTPKHSLERVNVYGNYEPDNCIWLLLSKQQRNTRRTKLDETVLPMIQEWLEAGISQQHIADLLHVHQTTISTVKRNQTWRAE